ncbi:uncharacterized protein N7483_009922 [Penicillium malachiteum]|uniref:uncharacterized protein n=1 Tax=Penicillium malachiteum TaxID=1324776 RepID=UPI002548F0C1|nr:uncharacterized protein N7483_009922 [Penicillium malachiteum]KAJ5718840.1 hypothetical protein N7483_009922 [Penicillium malachiteum]
MLRRTRRAPTACLWCHHRKVRCDASIQGCPCTRCRQDGRDDCVLRRKFSKQNRATTPRESSPVGKETEVTLISPLITPENQTPADIRPSQFDSADLVNVDGNRFLNFDDLNCLPLENITFLYSQGALEIPSRNLTHEFVESYFKEIHPMVPALDEAQFWKAFLGHADHTISIFVFQALLFVSCSFVSLDILRKCGFIDKRDARAKLYSRAKLLFDLKVESKPFAKAQGAILLTHHTSAESPLAGSMWLTCAIENAMMIDAQPSSSVEDVSDSMRKRVWWSILLRDRSLCIGLRRRPQVTSINIYGCRDMLEETDFAHEMHSSEVHSYQSKKALLLALQEQCQLAVLLTDLTSLIFAPRVRYGEVYDPDECGALMQTLASIKNPLVQWWIHAQSRQLSENSRSLSVSSTLRNLTSMYYHAARVDLAQYLALLIEENPNVPADIYKKTILEIGSDLKAGIDGLNATMKFFSTHDVNSLPLSVLGYVGMPLVLAAIDLKLSNKPSETTSRQKVVDFLSKIVRHAESLYDVTDFVAAGTNQILQLAYVTTQDFFLSANSAIRHSSPDTSYDSGGGRSAVAQRTRKGRARAGETSRATNWLEAYIRCPRAYLLISTSVDYSLSVGRLPGGNSLPSLVREIASMCSMAQLPWTVQSKPFNKTHVTRLMLEPQLSPVRPGLVQSNKTNCGSEAHDGSLELVFSTPRDRRPSPINDFEASKNKDDQQHDQTSQGGHAAVQGLVNLDFLEFDANTWGIPQPATGRYHCSGRLANIWPSHFTPDSLSECHVWETTEGDNGFDWSHLSLDYV